MIETYVSIGKVTDYAIGVLKYYWSFAGMDIFECRWYGYCDYRYSSSNHRINLGNL